MSAKLLSIAVKPVMTYISETYTSDDPANLLRRQRINVSMQPQHVHMTRE